MSGWRTTSETLKEASGSVARVACVLLLLLFVAGCSSTTVGIGGGTGARPTSEDDAADISSRNTGKPLRVLSLDYEEALALALRIGEESFDDVKESNRGTVLVYDDNFWMGNARTEITPQIVENLDKESSFGIIFKLEADGYSGNPAPFPGRVNSMFLERLAAIQRSGEVASETFSNYQILKDRGVTAKIHDSIPVTYEGFKKYIDNKENARQHEGIWTDVNGHYTVGIIYDQRDQRYRYKAFIIESDRQNWKPGEIKFQINSLHGRGLVFGPYHSKSKSASRVVWEVGEKTLVALNDKRLVFLKFTQRPAPTILLAIPWEQAGPSAPTEFS